MQILIVEDDSFYANRLKEVLMDLGLKSSIVTSTESAISCDINAYDAAIIDVMLPNDPSVSGISHEEARAGYLSGVALARRFREKKSKYPLILFSGGSFEGEQWAKENQIPFFSKEDGPGALKKCLGQVLRSRLH